MLCFVTAHAISHLLQASLEPHISHRCSRRNKIRENESRAKFQQLHKRSLPAQLFNFLEVFLVLLLTLPSTREIQNKHLPQPQQHPNTSQLPASIMARPYKSQLEMIRQKALADGCTHAIFWEKWSATMTSVLQDNPAMSSDSQIYKAEKTFFEKHCMYPLPSRDPHWGYSSSSSEGIVY